MYLNRLNLSIVDHSRIILNEKSSYNAAVILLCVIGFIVERKRSLEYLLLPGPVTASRGSTTKDDLFLFRKKDRRRINIDEKGKGSPVSKRAKIVLLIDYPKRTVKSKATEQC